MTDERLEKVKGRWQRQGPGARLLPCAAVRHRCLRL